MPSRRRWRRRDEERYRDVAWERRERMLATPLIADSFIGRGTTGGRWVLQPREMVDNENRRRHLVVCRSLTRVGLFFQSRRETRQQVRRVQFVIERKNSPNWHFFWYKYLLANLLRGKFTVNVLYRRVP